MSIKSIIQIFILLLIILIMGGVYYEYFDPKKNIIEEASLLETSEKEQLEELEKKLYDLELKNIELINKLDKTKEVSEKTLSENTKEKIIQNDKINIENESTKKIEKKDLNIKKEVKNLVKDVEYTSIDQKGNRFHLLANSGKSNINNNDILDLINVRGKITSDIRDTIYIVSDFAQYNSINLNSKFYENVIINYQDKEITCINFDINMETDKAIAYNDVIITDPKSIMKAGIVEFDLKTQNININPKTVNADIEVITN